MTDIIQELRSLVAKATPGPWAYRPREFDDWGFIRVAQADAEGWQPIVALGRAGPVESDHDEHRRNKTDPYGPNAELIVAAINHLPALLDRLEAAERGGGAFPDHNQRLAARMGGRLVQRDDIGAIIDRSRAKYQIAACDADLGRKERTRCSHYVQVLDEITDAIREVKP